MKLHIINDDRRIERYQPLMDELARQTITDYQIWPPIEDTKSVVRSINLSHKQIIEWARSEKLQEIAIAEDDVFFPAEDGWQHFLKNKPSYFDMYLGGCYSGIEWGWDEQPYAYTKSPVGLHCYIINARYYDKFLATDPNVHIDTAQKDGVFKVCYPMPALQNAGFSSNNMAYANYNTILAPADIYGRLHNIPG